MNSYQKQQELIEEISRLAKELDECGNGRISIVVNKKAKDIMNDSNADGERRK